ncbi:MAG TPA: GAF and ANTAR domain-containing protein [Nocardioidaceae bacterium]|nr:GAF and ANTAR domain-containing protein [Nocardioidaceae bacterium]
MEPIPESLEALTRLSAPGEGDLVANIKEAALRVVEAVPECVALSISHFDEDLTFTLLATADDMRILDAAQYLDGGPCQQVAIEGEELALEDVLDEERWQLFALASAIKGVRSSLSLPLRRNDTVYGSINFYGRTDYAFIGRERDLAMMFGATVQEAVANADLSMASIGRARKAVQTLDERDTINTAVGVLSARHRISVNDAYNRLLDAANRAGISPLALADLVLRQRAT